VRRTGKWGLTALIVGLGLVLSQQARADGLRYWDCPKPSYSPLHYWAPSLYRARAYTNPYPPGLYATDHFPGVPFGYNVQTFPCPAADPAALPYSYPFTVSPPAPSSAPRPR
jgi:hypothetical protein